METNGKNNEIFVGKKPIMAYVTGVVMQFNMGVKDVTIKARGQYISRAVDIAEVVRNRFMKDVQLGSINIGSDEFDGENGRKVRISTIEIKLMR
jgi:DNA-binding protein